MNGLSVFVLPAFCGLLAGTSLAGANLSTYRNFKLGMDLATVARLAGADPSGAKTIHSRPALIQELDWTPGLSGLSSQDEAVEQVLFSFYNGELFQVVVNYDRHKTEGLKADDLIESISATYGAAAKRVPAARTALPPTYSSDRTETLARWEDPESVLRLMRSDYGPSFGLVLVSRRVDALARAAILEAARLDLQDAPQREAERLRQQVADEHVAEEKARLANKRSFQP